MWGNSFITAAGAALISQWAAGGTMTITKVQTGTGTQTDSELKADTALKSAVTTATVASSKKVTGGVSLSIRIGAHTTQYTCTQVGIFGKLGSGSETLIAIYQDSTGVAIPSTEDASSFAYILDAIIAATNAGTLAITVEEGTWMDAATYDPDGDGKVMSAVQADKAAALSAGTDKTNLDNAVTTINSLGISDGKVAKAVQADKATALSSGTDKTNLDNAVTAINSLGINNGKVAKSAAADTAAALSAGTDKTNLNTAVAMANHIHIGTQTERDAYTATEGDIWFLVEA